MARRGKLWISEVDVRDIEEVSAAIRLDTPSPFGARIRRVVEWPIAAASLGSSVFVLLSVYC